MGSKGRRLIGRCFDSLSSRKWLFEEALFISEHEWALNSALLCADVPLELQRGALLAFCFVMVGSSNVAQMLEGCLF